MFYSIQLTDNTVWACENRQGIFMKKSDFTWGQVKGTGDTPYFKNHRQFSQYLHAHIKAGDGTEMPPMKRGSASANWEQDD